MYKEKRKVNRKSFDWYGLSQRFSIRKYHFGAASVLLGTALILGSPQASAKADDAVSANTALTSTGQGVDEGTNSATDGLKNVTLPTASTTEAAVLEKPTLSAEEIAKQAAASETHAITSPSETAKEESKPATSDAVVKTNTEEQSKTDKLTEKETKVEEKAEKKAEPDDSKKEETKKVSSEESTVTESNKKKEEVAPKRSKRSRRALPDGETTDYSGAKISGRLNDGKTQYAVGDQILGSYNLDVSSPTKIEEGGYILITASDNEPLDTFEIGSSLRYEKVNNNQYKLYTGELSGGAYANINVSYKLKKFETGKDSNTTIKAELFDKNNTLIKSTNFSNTNTTGTPYVSVDTRNGIRRQTLLETNQPETEIDVSKSKDLQLSLKSTNKEAAAITKIDHAVELPAGVTIAQTSLDDGWRLENGVAKYTRLVPSSTTMFAGGDNTQNELLYLNVSNGGTPAEFLTGKKLTFKDNATYTDKSGFTNTTSDDVTVTVRAVNPKESIGGSGENNSGTGGSTVPTKSDVQVAIFNDTMEKNNSRVVNIAMPYINTKTEDTRRINLSGNYGDSHGPASVKEVEISIDSNIDQNRAIEFYAIWTPTDKGKSTFVSYEDNPESLGLNSTLTFEVYSVTNGTESKIGEVSLRKGDVADKVALPDGTTTVKLKPKGNMPLETAGLQAVGLFLSQDLKGLEAAKELAKEGNKVESIVTASVYTHGYEEPKVAVSKTTFANSRDAIKLVPATNPINTTLAGNLTQELSSQYEVYEYSPNGLGNRIYNKQTWDRKTFVDLQDISAKNAKLLVELPDGFSYAGNDDSVKTIENYNNSGKTVLEVTPKNQNSENPLSPNLQFKVDNWVESGKYPVKYTLVWNEDERVVGINPNNDYDGTNATITNTSTFTYELPVINNSATRLMTQVTDQPTDSSTYSTGAYNLAPNDDVKYRLSLTNSSNAATRNNVVISTLPRVSDKNIVLNSKDRGSQFDVHMTAAATTPEGWTAYYSTTPVSGTAVELEKTITLTADQVTDWSTVTAVKFVSNQDVSLKAGSTAAFYIPAKASSTATNNQVAVLTSATRTDGQDTFNETNPARISIKIEDVKKGAVKVAYENKDNVSIKDTVTAIESRAYKKGYDVDTKEYKPDTLIGKDGKEYYFVKVKDSSQRPTGTIDSPEVTVTYVYDLLYDETEESHTVTRTIKYIDAAEKTKQVADPVTQTVTIKRVNKVNRKTGEKIEGTWSTANWDEKTSPSVENYNAPNRDKVDTVPVTSTTENITEVVEYTQGVDTKTVATKQTVTYEGAGENTPAPNEQADYTFTGKTNKVTNVTTWNEETHTYGVVTTPQVEGYYADKAQAGGKEVTPTTPEASDKVVYKPLGKVILVDEGGNEIPNTQKPTYKNNPNDPTVGGETPIPEIPDGYEIKPNQDVPGFNPEGKVVTPSKPGEDTRIVLVAKQGDITKATKQTVTYEGAGENTPAPNEQADYTFTGKTNKVTNVTTWNEETHTYGVVTTPQVEGYYADKAQAGGKEVTPTTPEASDKVVYKPLGKVILVDEGGNEIPNTPKPTYKNNPNDPTIGGETPIPEIPEGYEIKPNQDVPGFNPEGKVVTPPKPGEDTRIVLIAKQGDITKATKQTVTYEGAGENTPAPNEQADYTFTGKTNKVTNVTTWNEETHTYGVVTTPQVEGYYADKAQAGGKEVTPTTPEASDKVVYKPLGKVILVDEGGNEIPNTQKPTYKNNPNDPTVGGETPIPEIPEGYEIKPKQDVPGFNPEGKVVTPPKPGEDTRIVLVKVNQKVTVTYIVEGISTVLHTDNLEGKSGEPINYSTTAKLTELKQSGYNLVSDGFTTATDKNYDNNPKVDQSFLVTVAKTIPVTPTTPQNPNEDPQNPKPGDPIDPKNPNGPTWTKEALDKLNNIKSVTRTITYIKDGTTEEVSPTEAPKWTDKVSFTRTVVVNSKDGSVVGYDTTGDGIADVAATDTTSGWKAAGTAKFAEKTSPVVKGYVVKSNQDTQGDLVEADGSKVKASTTDLTVDSPNQDLKVRYVPVGTWIPKVPEGETPIDPIPYPNDPTDSGKVVDPNKPTDPNEPNKPSVPVVPHIPGTTPKDPDGNPLKPVDPKDPSKGYVPPTPKTPTENTEIKYEKDTQKAVTKFKDPSGNPIPGVNNIEETGKSGEPLTKETEVTTEIAKLIAKGYDLVSNNYGKDNNGNFDKDSGKDQEYTVVLTPHVEPIKPFDPTNPNDPNTPKPGQPIDPKNPDGPKWTKELIDKLNTTKHVTRTITYVDDKGNKVEYTDKAGNKSTADVTDKVTFTREAKINVVTGNIEYGKWTPVNNDTTFDKVTSPVVPGYVLKDPAQKVVESKDVTETTPDETIKVVYVPVGKLVPKVPDGVTPPTPTPYDNDPQDPGKVVPPSPTKPQDPQDPNSPKVPVIPHIPGTTPKVPQDPTKPVDPNTNPLVPLKPVDPKDPSKGYEVPPVPTNPGTDTPIVYENDKQKAITNFVDNNGKVVSDPVVDQGNSGSKFTKSGEVESKIKELLKKGYVATSNDYPSADKDRVFDNDKDKDQIFNVKVTPLIVPTDPNSPDKPQVPTDPTKPVGPNNPLKPVTPSTPEPGKPVFPEDPNSPVWPDTVKDLVTESSATRTITYVDHNGKEVAVKHTETIKFKRTAKVNLVTGDITYGDWTVVGDDTILNGNKLPKVDGYIARGGDIKESQEDIKAEAGKNITQTVVYAKLGSWIPRLPEGQTNVPPTPYPNDPTDPTKPGTDKPKVPYVPGFIPVDPNGNPLKPVDPNDPTKGYEVPDVPADPTQDTPIKYIPVPTPNNGGGNNGGGGGNTPTPQPQPNPTPQPEPSPAPVPVAPEQPVAPVTPEQPAEPATPQYMDGQRELPNTGTEANSSLAALGLLGALSGFGLIARKKRKDEE